MYCSCGGRSSALGIGLFCKRCQFSTSLNDTVTNFGRKALLVVDDDAPAKVELLVLDLDQTTRLKEGQGVVGVRDNLAEVGSKRVKLLAELVVLRYALFIGYNDSCAVLLLLLELYVGMSIDLTSGD